MYPVLVTVLFNQTVVVVNFYMPTNSIFALVKLTVINKLTRPSIWKIYHSSCKCPPANQRLLGSILSNAMFLSSNFSFWNQQTIHPTDLVSDLLKSRSHEISAVLFYQVVCATAKMASEIEIVVHEIIVRPWIKTVAAAQLMLQADLTWDDWSVDSRERIQQGIGRDVMLAYQKFFPHWWFQSRLLLDDVN